jgi:hypothetical protein
MPCPSTSCFGFRIGHGCLHEVLEPLVAIPIPKATRVVVNIDDEDLIMER